MASQNVWSVHVLYGGEWTVDAASNEHRYINYKRVETLLLDEAASFSEMVNNIICVLGIDPTIKDTLLMQYLPKYLSNISVLPIKNDYHVRCFMNEIIRHARIPICVTIREVSHAEDEYGGSNSPIKRLSSDSPIWTNDVIHSRHFDENNLSRPNADKFGSKEDDVPPVQETIIVDDEGINASARSKEPVHGPRPQDIHCVEATKSSRAGGSASDKLDEVVDVSVGDVFETRYHLFLRMSMLAVKHFFEWKVLRANSKFWYIRCTDVNCKWRMNASAIGMSDAWKITKYDNIHTCQSSLVHSDNRQACSKVIGSWIKCKYLDVCRPYRPNEIISDIRAELGVNISYLKAWRSRESALHEVRGDYEGSYTILPAYLHVLQEVNPGTVIELSRDEAGRFKYLFFAFGASIRGFRSHMRPVIAVDACFLKGRYPGSLIVATCMDGNNQVYPVAWGIVDSENDASWEWFLQRLKVAIGNETDGLVFVSDRHKSIAKGISSVFPDSYHGACIYHLSNNLRAKFKNNAVIPLYFKTAKAYTMAEFNEHFARISMQNSRVSEYLREIGIERWSRAHSGGRRYTIMTTNIAECLNALLRDARELPIHILVDYIRNTLQRWFHERRTAASEMKTLTTPYIEQLIASRMREAQSYVVEPVDIHRWFVRDIANRAATVDLLEKTCTCRVFDMDQIPCVHALAASRRRQIDHYTLCSRLYHTEALVGAYADSIMPVGDAKDWNVTADVLAIQLSPPEPRAKSGRRKKKRIPSTGEEKVKKKCGRCGGSGHNRQTCSNAFVSRDNV